MVAAGSQHRNRDRKPDDIVADMAATRQRLERTLDVLERKLQLENLAREAIATLRTALLRRPNSPLKDGRAGKARPERAAGPRDTACRLGEDAVGGNGASGPRRRKVFDVLADAAATAIAAAIEQATTPRAAPPVQPKARRRRRPRRDRAED